MRMPRTLWQERKREVRKMKKYNTPSLEILEFKISDVITLSAEDLFAEFDDVINAPSTWF